MSNSPGTAIVVNSTISGNSGFSGGGISDGSSAGVSLTNCTISNNSAAGSDGVETFAGNTKVRNTIIAGNGAGADLKGPFMSQGNNLIGRSAGSNGFTNGSNGDQVGERSKSA